MEWSLARLGRRGSGAGRGVIHVYITLKCLYKPFCVITEGFMGHSVLWELREEASVMITQPVWDQDKRRERALRNVVATYLEIHCVCKESSFRACSLCQYTANKMPFSSTNSFHSPSSQLVTALDGLLKLMCKPKRNVYRERDIMMHDERPPSEGVLRCLPLPAGMSSGVTHSLFHGQTASAAQVESWALMTSWIRLQQRAAQPSQRFCPAQVNHPLVVSCHVGAAHENDEDRDQLQHSNHWC